MPPERMRWRQDVGMYHPSKKLWVGRCVSSAGRAVIVWGGWLKQITPLAWLSQDTTRSRTAAAVPCRSRKAPAGCLRKLARLGRANP